MALVVTNAPRLAMTHPVQIHSIQVNPIKTSMSSIASPEWKAEQVTFQLDTA